MIHDTMFRQAAAAAGHEKADERSSDPDRLARLAVSS